MRTFREAFRRYKIQNRQKTRARIINELIEKFKYKKYCEIGVMVSKHTFDKIKVDYKIGVDPGVAGFAEATHLMTSDEFFEQNNENFDIVFIDGLHEGTQVYKDIVNSLDVLNEGGTIVCHDMNPLRELHQRFPEPERPANRPFAHNGDCWKAFVQLRMERDDLKMCVIDADWGLGVIQKGSQKKIEETELTYENFNKHRESWLNLISEKEFFDKWVNENI